LEFDRTITRETIARLRPDSRTRSALLLSTEVPVRRILTGVPVERAANRAARANVESLDYFIDYERTQRDYSLT
jgi:hypothetical protein